MAVALTQFVQPSYVIQYTYYLVVYIYIYSVLMGEQSSNSSIQIINEEDGDDPISVRPSPSPSPSKSLSHCQSPFISSPSSLNQVSDDTNDDDQLNSTQLNENGKTNILIMDQETESLKEESISISMSQCRYCYQSISRTKSVSQCLCSSVLCKECLINELKLCHGRNNGLLQCTVCKVRYTVFLILICTLKN